MVAVKHNVDEVEQESLKREKTLSTSLLGSVIPSESMQG